MYSRNDIRDQIIRTAVANLKHRIITVEEAELAIESILDYLITAKHINITGLGFEMVRSEYPKCDVDIIYRN